MAFHPIMTCFRFLDGYYLNLENVVKKIQNNVLKLHGIISNSKPQILVNYSNWMLTDMGIRNATLLQKWLVFIGIMKEREA